MYLCVSLREPSEAGELTSETGPRAANLSAARALAFAVSVSRFLGVPFVSSERRRRAEISAISSTAAWNGPSLAFDGLLKPLIFLTNWSEAARISSAVTGGSKLKRVLMFLHILTAKYQNVHGCKRLPTPGSQHRVSRLFMTFVPGLPDDPSKPGPRKVGLVAVPGPTKS